MAIHRDNTGRIVKFTGADADANHECRLALAEYTRRGADPEAVRARLASIWLENGGSGEWPGTSL